MIAGADGRHPGCFLFGGQAVQGRQRTARFERSGALQELEFGVHPGIATQKRLESCATQYRGF